MTYGPLQFNANLKIGMRTGFKSEVGMAQRSGPRSLILSDQKLTKIPQLLSVRKFEAIQTLDVSRNELSDVSAFLLRLPGLESADLQHNRLSTLPAELGKLRRLRVLRLDFNDISSLPQSIGDLPLETLSVCKNRLFTLPTTIGKLSNTLKVLNVSDNSISVLPSEIGSLLALEELYLHNNRLSGFPCSLAQLKSLRVFSLEWFLYTPLSCYLLKGTLAESVCDSLRELCRTLQSNRMYECSLVAFLSYFSDANFAISADQKTARTQLHTAACNNHIGVLKGLLMMRPKPNVDVKDREQHTPLTLAIKQGCRESVKLLLDNGADATAAGGFGSPLHLAVAKGELWVVKELLARGASPNVMDDQQNTPIHILFACFDANPHRSETIGETLLLAGAKPNVRNGDKWTAVHLAVKKGQARAVEWVARTNPALFERGMEEFDLNLQGGIEVSTPLHIAGHGHNFAIVKALLSAGADVFVANGAGRLPRQIVKGDFSMSKVLKKGEVAQMRRLFDPDALIDRNLREEEGCGGNRSGNSEVTEGIFGTPTPFAKAINEDEEREREKEKEQEDKENQRKNAHAKPKCPKAGKLTINLNIVNRGLNEMHYVPSGYRTMTGSLNRSGLWNSTKFMGAKTINIFYLRDKVMNNRVPLYERYDALNSILEFRQPAQTSQAVTELLEKLGAISSVSLQIDIIKNAHLARGLVAAQLLTRYSLSCHGRALQRELQSEICVLRLQNGQNKREVGMGYTRRTEAKVMYSIKEPKACGVFRSTKYFGQTCGGFNGLSNYNSTCTVAIFQKA